MATTAQIQANGANAQLSTGPRSVPGKESSRGNSHVHGLASETTAIERAHPEFAARLAEWKGDLPVETAEQRFALETAVAMTFRIEACGSAYHAAVASTKVGARHTWDVDRMAEAADLLSRLGRRPEVVARKLEATYQGVAALVELWIRLGESLESGAAWDDAEVSVACDLLGIPKALRVGHLPFDPRDPSADARESRLVFVARELDRLRELRGRLRPADVADRARAEAGDSALLSSPVRLVLRYEREAVRRYERAMEVVRSSAPSVATPASPEPVRPGPPARVAPAVPPDEEADRLRDAMAILGVDRLDGFGVAAPSDEASPHVAGVAPPKPHLATSRPRNRHARRREAALARRSG